MINKEKIEQLQAEIKQKQNLIIELEKQNIEEIKKSILDAIGNTYSVELGDICLSGDYTFYVHLKDNDDVNWKICFTNKQNVLIDINRMWTKPEIISQINDIITKLGWLK